MSIAAKANKVSKSIKKPMSIPSKTRKDQKTHEHSSESEQGVQKHQKTISIPSKTRKGKKTMNIAAKANKVCKSIIKPMSIPSKTRKDQKTNKHSSNPCEKSKKP
jgi:hypothetical protein